jgi:hypothetical protein
VGGGGDVRSGAEADAPVGRRAMRDARVGDISRDRREVMLSYSTKQ